MAIDLRYTLYDTVVFGATANTESTLFQVAQGADATHTESFTNMKGAGVLPVQEKHVVDIIRVIVDGVLALADIPKVFNGSFIELRVSDLSVLKIPLAMAISNSYWSGHYTQAAAADKIVMGLDGDGYHLDKPITIEGGKAFKVRVFQSVAIAANTNLKVVLDGIYTLAT